MNPKEFDLSEKFKKTDYLCEGCRQWKMLKKRKSDGKLLCKKCFKNKSLTMEIKKLVGNLK